MPRYMTVQMTRDHSYRDRELRAGDTIELPRRDAALLVAARRARKVRETAASVDVTPAASTQQTTNAVTGDDELKAARADYEAALGKKAFHGWDVAALRSKIAEATDQKNVDE